MKQVTFALIGAGQRGQFAYAPQVLQNPHKARFVAVVEPDAFRRQSFAETYGLDKERCYDNEDDFFAANISCDAVMICTQDRQHFQTAIRAMRAGYHVLLEKPMSPSGEECVALGKCAEETNRILVVCHVLRYTAFFEKIKELLDSGIIGRLVTITHNENTGFFHQAHSFVRGNWRNSKESSPMVLAKSCHDMDILLWLAGGNCTQVSSFGALTWFTGENAPEGCTDRCTDGCAIEGTCPYSALKIYLRSGCKSWPTSVITTDLTEQGILKALREGPYGRCVYRCDNDVVDHQSVSLEFDNGVTAIFNMSAFTHDVSRTIKLMGTHGEIRGHMEKGELEIHDFTSNDVMTYTFAPAVFGHSGGDSGLMRDFIALLAGQTDNAGKTSHRASVQSHLMALAAEESRVTGQTVKLTQSF